jgi:short-subunit dehydrogenase
MKTFLSIGTGPGIGITTAKRFASEGFRVVLTARDPSKLAALAGRVAEAGSEVVTERVDASDPRALGAMIGEVTRRYGEVSVLHYNAATLRNATIEAQAIDTFDADLAVNIGGAMAAIHTVSRDMRDRRSGTILLTGGGFAIQPNPEYISISVGKAGIRALALGLFDDFKASGVHVATVTVAGFVEAGSPQVDEVADRFWRLHSQPADAWEAESVYHPQQD